MIEALLVPRDWSQLLRIARNVNRYAGILLDIRLMIDESENNHFSR